MKKIFLLLSLCCYLGATAQNSSDKYLLNYIKFWGYLKYYHPAIAGGKADADVMFMGWIEKVKAVKTDKEYGAVASEMLQSLGPVSQPRPGKAMKLFTRNDRTGWIAADRLLPASVKKTLLLLRKYGYPDSINRYMPATFYETEIPAEKAHGEVRFPNVDVQLMSLARYWNAIEYLFPYKYMITQNWDSVLVKQVPFFAKSMTADEYELHLLQLNSTIEDTHGGIVEIKQKSKIYGSFFPPFLFAFAGDTIVVTEYLDSTACAQQGIRRGDLIVGIGNKTIAEAVASRSQLVSASNPAKKKSLLSSIPLLQPLRGPDSVISIRVLRDGGPQAMQLVLQKPTGKEFVENINAFYNKQNGYGTTSQNDFVLRSITPDIAQVDAARLSIFYNNSTTDQPVDSLLQLMRQHKTAILLDLRCYATQAVFYNKFLPALGRKLKPFATLLAHSTRFPGLYYEHDIFSPVKQPPLESAYKGKLILLVSEATQSQSELITMIMQACGPVTVIGTQTAGCDGDLVYLPVPGGYTLGFSGRHVAYRDGTQSQKTGVKRDIKITLTAKGIAEGRDEILEAGLKFAGRP